MFQDFPISARLPASDLARARAWYEEKLGLVPEVEDPGGLWYRTGGAWFLVFTTPAAGTAQNTAAGWSIQGMEMEDLMSRMRARGVVFETYEMPGVEMRDGLAVMGSYKGAWFKDSEDNILEITNLTV